MNPTSRFEYGDVVRIKGYSAELFIIEGYHAESICYEGEVHEEIIYMVKNMKNGIVIESRPEEIQFIRKPNDKVVSIKGEIVKVVVDELLDEYNDLIALFNIFGDKKYKVKAKRVLYEIEKIN